MRCCRKHIGTGKYDFREPLSRNRRSLQRLKFAYRYLDHGRVVQNSRGKRLGDMIKIFAVIPLLLTITCCNNSRSDRADNQSLYKEEIAIYMELARSKPSREIVISGTAIESIGITSPEHVQALLPFATESVSVDFLSKNVENLILQEDVSIGDDFVLLSSKDLDERLSRLNSFNTFSRVGFDSNRRTAIVWHYYTCGVLCGQGGLYLLEYRGEKWEIVAESDNFRS